MFAKEALHSDSHTALKKETERDRVKGGQTLLADRRFMLFRRIYRLHTDSVQLEVRSCLRGQGANGHGRPRHGHWLLPQQETRNTRDRDTGSPRGPRGRSPSRSRVTRFRVPDAQAVDSPKRN